MAIGYLDYLTNNGVRYFPYVRVEGIINTDGKPFSQWMTQVNTHNHDIRYAASAHQHSGYLKTIGPNDIRTTASYRDPLNIVADSGGTAELKLYSSVTKDDVGAIQYKNTVLSMRINETAWFKLQSDGVYFNNDKLATEQYVQKQVEAGGGAGVDLSVLDQRYASNVHNHMANEISGLPTTLPSPYALSISFGTKSVTYDGRTPQTFNLTTSDLDIDIPSTEDLDARYYKKNDINTILNTNIILRNNGSPNIRYTRDLIRGIVSYEYNGLEHSTPSNYPSGTNILCNGAASELKVDNSMVYRMSAIRDIDGSSKIYFSLSGYNNTTSIISRENLPVFVLSGRIASTQNQEAIVNGDLIVKGTIVSNKGMLNNRPVTVKLTAAGWTGSGPFTQVIPRPNLLVNEYPILVKNLSYDASQTEITNYNKAFTMICEGCATIGSTTIVFKVIKKPTIDISVGLA